jgi:DNA-binding CsgD family transcriptional regulator
MRVLIPDPVVVLWASESPADVRTALGISGATVKKHLERIYGALDASPCRQIARKDRSRDKEDA